MPASNLDQVFATSTLIALEGDKERSVEVRIFAPMNEPDLERCVYQILVDGVVKRESAVPGIDGIQALLGALWKVEIELKHMSPFKEMTFDIDEQRGFGFIHSKRVWDSVYK